MSVEQQRLMSHIVIDPEVLAGKPTVKGTRISVELVLDRLAAEPDLNVLFQDFPRLTLDDVRACLAYASAVIAGEQIHFLQPNDTVLSRA